MISPYVRRLRLGQELRALRAAAGLSQEQLAKKIGKPRVELSRMESGHSVNQSYVLLILDTLGATGERWDEIMTVAGQAGGKGWWDSFKGMGDRQALIADLEAGAATIRKYEQTFVPGLLQTPEFLRARNAVSVTIEPMVGTSEGILEGRWGRQQMMRRPGGPTLEVIIDEMTIRRLPVPADVMKRQIDHLTTTVNADPQITLLVLPACATIRDFAVPRCTFSIYTYPDPGDPQVVAIDTVTSDIILTDPDQVTPYERLYERLREAALSPADSVELLASAAAELATR